MFLLECGDIKYIAILGLMFGYRMQVISIILSAIIMLPRLLIRRQKEIPWGYYVSIAMIIVVIWKPYLGEIIEVIG